MARKINYHGNSKVIKRLCERVNDDSLEKIVIRLQETIYNLVADIYGAQIWFDGADDIIIDDTGEELMFITGDGNINDRLAALEALDILVYDSPQSEEVENG